MKTKWLISVIILFVFFFPQNLVFAGKDKNEGIKVVRDNFGVPHLYAKNKKDLYEAYGYVMAKDRLFQLEMFRRGNEGTVSEIFGEDYLSKDEQSRRDGYSDKEIKKMIDGLDRQPKELIAKFAEGISRYVNEALKDPDDKLSKEFHEYQFLPQKWTSTDVVRVYMVSMTYFMDNHQELKNAEILAKLEHEYGTEVSRKMFDDLVWKNDPSAPTSIVSEGKPKRDSSSQSLQILSSAVIKASEKVGKERENFVQSSEELGLPLKIGSNAAIVGSEKSATGNALLFSGPQVGFVAPGFLYEVGLHAPGFDMEGSGFIGYPFIMFGANNHFALSATAGYGNVTDIFEEKLNANNASQYLYKGKWRDMEKRKESFTVKGDNREKKTVEKIYYRTVHGPVISRDETNNVAYSKSWSFRGTEAQSMSAYMKANWAKNLKEFENAASEYTMSLNWYYADKKGDIAYYHVGRYPVRNSKIDERIPTPGTGEYEWKGFIPFKENPHVINPKIGYVVNWNNKPSKEWVNGEYSYYWGEDNRVQQYINGMEARGKVTLEDINEINYTASFAQLRANLFKPLLIDVLDKNKSTNGNYTYLIEKLEEWNNLKEDENKDGYYDAGIAAFFDEWWNNLHDKLFRDELGDFYGITKEITDHRYGASLAYKILSKESTNYKWVNVDQEKIIMESTNEVLAKLQSEKGVKAEKWRMPIKTMTFGEKSLIGIPHGYGSMTPIIEMNRGSENHYIEMTPKGPSGFNITPPGQIGFVKKDGTISDHYDDQLVMFAEWKFKPYLFNKKDIYKAAKNVSALNMSK
ncbi:penicillin acylase family protein [Peribacillus sp. TH24]|uniref:penicillin acylase family protein n=1 Tax=Peribacillus sp. TH24 TaxID=2798483 RepID=UPI001912A52E|nr:penicillin acylase family protein [Peribacillus sp. TH24]MBK5445380.1 penicillin acylase family protein [Peribacillus sp. TH24]